MKYTINKLAKISGVTVRTLHYYDEIGLLKPSYRTDNEYRYYEEPQLLKLQQILFFRELEFSLDKIKEILESPNFNILKSLDEQKQMLLKEKKRVSNVLITIEKTIRKIQGEQEMKDEELYNGLTKKQEAEYRKEASERWGKDTVDESYRRLNQLSKEEQKALFDQGVEITKAIGEKMKSGIAPDAAETQSLIEQHRKHIGFFYDCKLDIYRGLAEMYLADPRFAAYYEKFAPGLAQYMHDAMIHYCETNK